MSTPKTYDVTLPKDKRPGLLRCGDLLPGKTYQFPAAEAVRLVDAKGFIFVSPADEPSARAEVDAAQKATESASRTTEAKANTSPPTAPTPKED